MLRDPPQNEAGVKVWVDIIDSSHVLFFAPVVRRLEEQGHVVTVTARRFASAELTLRRLGLIGVLTGRHRGGSVGARAVGLANRTAQLLASAASGRFDVALGSHASDFVLTAWALGVPQLTLLDGEHVHRADAVNARLVDRMAVPEAVTDDALLALGGARDKVFRYPGFTEEYYLHDVRPDPGVLDRLGVSRDTVVGVVRPPRDERDAAFDARWRAQRALPAATGDRDAAPADGSGRRAAADGTPGDGAGGAAAHELEAFVRDLAARRDVTLVLLPRCEEQRRRFATLDLTGLVVPDGPVDGVSLIAAADFVLGAGGVMDREAAALGTPAYTLSRRLPAAVDAALLADGRLRRARKAADIALHKKDPRMHAVDRRDPQLFVDEALELARRNPGPARLSRLRRPT